MKNLSDFISNNNICIYEFLNTVNKDRFVPLLEKFFKDNDFKVKIFAPKDFKELKDVLGITVKEHDLSSDNIYVFFEKTPDKFFDKDKYYKENELLDFINNKISKYGYWCDILASNTGSTFNAIRSARGAINMPKLGGTFVVLNQIKSNKSVTDVTAYHITSKELYESIIKSKGLRTKGRSNEEEKYYKYVGHFTNDKLDKKKINGESYQFNYSPRIFVTLSTNKSQLLRIMKDQSCCYYESFHAMKEPVCLKINLKGSNISLYPDPNNPDNKKAYFCTQNIPAKFISIDEELTSYLKGIYDKDHVDYNEEVFKLFVKYLKLYPKYKDAKINITDKIKANFVGYFGTKKLDYLYDVLKLLFDNNLSVKPLLTKDMIKTTRNAFNRTSTWNPKTKEDMLFELNFLFQNIYCNTLHDYNSDEKVPKFDEEITNNIFKD